MSLGLFYNHIDQFMFNEIQTYFGHIPNILYLYTSEKKTLDVGAYYMKMGIGDNIEHFLKHLTEYENSLFGKKFDAVNIRFSLKYFFKSSKYLEQFIEFITKHLKKRGFFYGYSLAPEKINLILMKDTELTVGPYSLKVIPNTVSESIFPYETIIQMNNNGTEEITHLMDINELVKICFHHRLFYVGKIDFEKIYTQHTTGIILEDAERTFGFFNNIYIFQHTNLD